MKKKLLVIGGSGLVGSTLINYALTDFDIHYTINTNKAVFGKIPFTKIDFLEDRSKIINLIDDFKPDFTIHTAAISSVDLCETNPALADVIHIDVTKDISEVCKKNNSRLMYLSTDAVFPGKLNKKYTELDNPNPINYYGKTKLSAEKIILESSPHNVVLRTAVIYGWHKKSRFTNWIIGTLREHKMVDPFTDQFNTPTLVDDLVKAIIKIIKMEISGLYHAAGKTCTSRYSFALTLAKKFGLDQNLIKPVTSIQKKQEAPRSVSTCLDSTKLEKAIDFEFCDLEKGVSFIYDKSTIILL